MELVFILVRKIMILINQEHVCWLNDHEAVDII
jgi:hypothetical protein